METKKVNFTMKIEKIDSSKHQIKQRALMKANVIPQHPCISVFSGSQGGGKSTLVNNLLTKPHMYGLSMEDTSHDDEREKNRRRIPRGYFDAIFLLIGSDDDMYDALIDNGCSTHAHNDGYTKDHRSTKKTYG
jgi:septin family protein